VALNAASLHRHPVKTAPRARERRCRAGGNFAELQEQVAAHGSGLILAMTIAPALVQGRDAARGLINLPVQTFRRLQMVKTDCFHFGALGQWDKQLRAFGELRLGIVRRCDTKGFKVLAKPRIIEQTLGRLSKSRHRCRDGEVHLDYCNAMIRMCTTRPVLGHLASAAPNHLETRPHKVFIKPGQAQWARGTRSASPAHNRAG